MKGGRGYDDDDDDKGPDDAQEDVHNITCLSRVAAGLPLVVRDSALASEPFSSASAASVDSMDHHHR
jgi:hypothetical protein